MNKYVKKRYQYMLVTTPASMVGSFFLFTGGWILGENDIVMIAAGPFYGGALSLGIWVLYEITTLFSFPSTAKSGTSSFALNFSNSGKSNSYVDWLLGHKDNDPDYDFIFKSYGIDHKLACEVSEHELLDFCKIGVDRANNQSLLSSSSGTFKRLGKNEHWSGAYFINKRNYTLEQVRACKTILTNTGQFVNWSQGRSGWAIGHNAVAMVEKAKRRWYKSATSKSTTKFNKVIQSPTMFGNVLKRFNNVQSN